MNAERRTPNAERRTPNAERRTPSKFEAVTFCVLVAFVALGCSEKSVIQPILPPPVAPKSTAAASAPVAVIDPATEESIASSTPEERLNQLIEVAFAETPLDDAVRMIGQYVGLPIEFDDPKLRDRTSEVTVTRSFEGVAARAVLEELLQPHEFALKVLPNSAKVVSKD